MKSAVQLLCNALAYWAIGLWSLLCNCCVVLCWQSDIGGMYRQFILQTSTTSSVVTSSIILSLFSLLSSFVLCTEMPTNYLFQLVTNLRCTCLFIIYENGANEWMKWRPQFSAPNISALQHLSSSLRSRRLCLINRRCCCMWMRLHSPAGSTFLREMTSWPPSWTTCQKWDSVSWCIFISWRTVLPSFIPIWLEMTGPRGPRAFWRSSSQQAEWQQAECSDMRSVPELKALNENWVNSCVKCQRIRSSAYGAI